MEYLHVSTNEDLHNDKIINYNNITDGERIIKTINFVDVCSFLLKQKLGY